MKGFIFDLDGTLLDSLGMWLDIDIKYMKMHGVEYKRQYSDDISKLNHEECAIYFRDVIGIKKDTEQMKKDWKEMSEKEYFYHLQLKPYAYEFVRECSKYGKCILATSCHRKNAQAVLNRTGLNEFIHEIITTNELGVNKDTPDIYLECAKHLGLDIKDCYVFEDVVTAIKAASSAGFHVVSMNDKMWLKEKENIIKYSKRNIDSFQELLDEMI